MKTSVSVIFMCFIVNISSENACPHVHVQTCGCVGLEQRLDLIELKLTNILERLDASLNKNEKEMEDLAANYTRLSSSTENASKAVNATVADIVASNSKLFNMITNLEERVNGNQKITDEKFIGLIANITTNYSRNSLQNQSTIASCKSPGTSGVFNLQFPNLKVYCEIDSLDGGWLVIQQRVDLTLDFNRSWTEYRNGFGVVGKNENFWLGLEHIHQITSDGQYELAVEMKNQTGHHLFARYSQFKVAGESDKYRLTVGGHSGTASDGLNAVYYTSFNNMQFSTFDNDNDKWLEVFCANDNGGGWWYNRCGICNVNRKDSSCWLSGSTNIEQKYTRMMIRQNNK